MPKKALKLIVILVAWELWKERNSRIFSNLANTPASIMAKIRAEAHRWVMTGANA